MDSLLARTCYSSDTGGPSPVSSRSPSHPGSDGNHSLSSTGSVKRRRYQPQRRLRRANNDDGVQATQDWLTKLRIPSPPRSDVEYKVGSAVEAIKLTADDARQWYCARVVDISQDDGPLVFVHYEGWPADHADWISPTLVRKRVTTGKLLYGPLGKEDASSWQDYASFYYSKEGCRIRNHTGLVHDRRMGLHTCPCLSLKTIHPERPDRIASIFQTLHNNQLLRYVRRTHAREATYKELSLAHVPAHIRNYCPVQAEQEEQDDQEGPVYDEDELDPNKRARKRPAISDDKGTSLPMMHGVGGDVVVQPDQEHIEQQQKQFLTAAAAADGSQANPTPIVISPPGLCKMVCGQLGIAADTTYHPLHTGLSARVAAGALINMVDDIVEGRLRNGFAAIRPPGHHAEEDAAMGFCYFNNVAVAVANALEKHANKIKKALILDWDIHHGNGTQHIFYNHPDVLYVSIHRWDNGTFYPYTGAPSECGDGPGMGKNVNIALSASKDKPKPMGDTEFIAALHHIVTPIARQFNPDMIFVSAGFDAAEGHPANLGGYNVTPRGFSFMTKMVKDLAGELCDGRLVLSLEGGYALEPLANAAAATLAQLLPSDCAIPENAFPSPQQSLKHALNSIKPNSGAVDSFREIIANQRPHWTFPDTYYSPNFRFNLPSEWRAKYSISTRTRRDVRHTTKNTGVKGY